MTASNISPNGADTRPLVAVGDIHGRLDLLDKLLAKVTRKMKGQAFRWIFLGDYIDRGPDSRQVIDTLIALKESYPDTVFLKGNHEEAMLDFLAVGEEADGWIYWGGEQTLESYGITLGADVDLGFAQEQLADTLPASHFSFLMDLVLRHDQREFVFVHAGLHPERAVDDQQAKDLLWIRDHFFDEGEGVFPDHIVVHGHTPVKRPDNRGWRINVDTGAFWSSKLTAVVLAPDRKPSFITT